MSKLPDTSKVACMTASQINKALDRIDKIRSKITDEFIATGRGHELPSETRHKTDPLALRSLEVQEAQWQFQREIERRYGPKAPHRLPSGRGFGPREKCRK